MADDWEKDYEKFVEPLIEENTPCYIFFRLDKKTSIGYEWLLISYTPDTAKIREKMLYASTKATLKKEFGTPHIKEEYHATSEVSDFAASNFRFREYSVSIQWFSFVRSFSLITARDTIARL